MGSKRTLLPAILNEIKQLRPRKVLDAFSGSGCVSYGMKTLGVQVHANDFLRFASTIAYATVKNNSTVLTLDDLRMLTTRNRAAGEFIQETFGNLYFEDRDNAFLDSLWANIQSLSSPLKRAMALAAACRAAMKKRPRGIFTFTGRKGWDGRKDLNLTMEEQFLKAAREFNRAVFSNGRKNEVFCSGVFALDPSDYDVVYIDPPYISPYSDCDYTRRYHFVEGFCTYWQGAELMTHTTTKKIRSYPTEFATKSSARTAFERLFHHFRNSTLVLSYSSNALPSKHELIDILQEFKKSVVVVEHRHKYSFGNHAHCVGRNKNSVIEYLFVAR